MDCSALSRNFPGKVFFPGSLEYTESTGSYFAAFENELSPTCVIRPGDAKDVSKIVKDVKNAALSGKVKVAVKGGGHTPWAGAANIDNGITIDLRQLTGVSVNSASKTASIGAGEQWRSVYENLLPQGLAVPGGRVSKVGVGGLITGGGLSYFAAARGFVCDSVVNYEVVLASGEIVSANANSNRDLFIALKGGSNNFGIVTRFDMTTFSQGKMWGGVIYYDSSAYGKLIKAFNDFTASSTPDEAAHIIVATSFSAGRETGVSNIYHSSSQPAPPSLSPFVAIQPQVFNSLREDSLLGFAEEQSAFSTDGARHLYFVTGFRLDEQLMIDVRELWLAALKPIENIPGLVLALVFQPLTKGILQKSAQRTGNSLGLKPEDGPLVVNLLASMHANAADDDEVIAAVLVLIEKIEALAAKRGKKSKYRFTNYGYKTQRMLEGYGRKNVNKLRDVSRTYDPDGFFQTGVPGGFKLSKVDDSAMSDD